MDDLRLSGLTGGNAEIAVMAKQWIQEMTSSPSFKKGAFSAQAQRAGKTTAAFARDVLAPGSRASATTKRRARLAQTFGKIRRRNA